MKMTTDELNAPKRARLQEQLTQRMERFRTQYPGTMFSSNLSGCPGLHILIGWRKRNDFIRPFMRRNNPRIEDWKNDPMNFDGIFLGPRGVVEISWTSINTYGKIVSKA